MVEFHSLLLRLGFSTSISSLLSSAIHDIALSCLISSTNLSVPNSIGFINFPICTISHHYHLPFHCRSYLTIFLSITLLVWPSLYCHSISYSWPIILLFGCCPPWHGIVCGPFIRLFAFLSSNFSDQNYFPHQSGP